MALPALLGAGARVVGGSLVKSVAKDKAKNFITGKKTKTKTATSEVNSQDNQRPGALAIRPQTSIVSPSAIIPAPIEETSSMKGGGEKSEEDILVVISKKVIEINSILKGTLAADKARSKSEKQTDEKKKRKQQESALEKASPKDKKDKEKKKTNIPGSGLFSGIFNFIKNIFLGSLLINFIDKKIPGEKSILSAIGGSLDFMVDLILGTLDAFGSFLLVGKNALDNSKEWLKNNRGPEAENRFDELIGGLTNLFNAAVIVGSVFSAIGGGSSSKKKKLKKAQIKKIQKRLSKGTDKKAIERYARRYGADAARRKFGSAGQAAANRIGLGGSQTIKGGLGRSTTRIVGKTLGPQAMKAVGPVIKKIGAGFSRVPVVGSLIVAVSSLLAGEPLGQAAFKGFGSAIGGFAGSFIPIPVVGTLIGTTIGTFLGDVLYSLFLGGGPEEAGEKFKKGISDSIKTMFDLSGLAANFVKEGFGRLIKNFPTVDVPNWFGVQETLGNVAKFIGVKEDSQFLEDGKLAKLPDLALLTPLGLPFLVPHIASSFLPDIFGESGVVNKIFGKNGTAWGGTGVSASSSRGEASNVAGEAGRFVEKNLESAAVAADGYGDYNRITEHPDFGGVKGTHASGSYHYVNRAIDIGAFTHEQGPIVNVINEFNKKKGIQPKELITGAQFPGTTMVDPDGHYNHVHVAYSRGGVVEGLTHAMLGEDGPEFVIDTDSYLAIKKAYPGLLPAINKAKGDDAVEVLMAYTDYERPPEAELVMVAGGSIPSSAGSNESSSSPTGGSSSPIVMENWSEIRYKFG